MKKNFKKAVFLLTTVLLLSLYTKNVNASLISITQKGQVMVKVLSAETSRVLTDITRNNGEFEVAGVQNSNLVDPSVGLIKKDGKVSLLVLSDGNYKELDVTDIKDDLIEIEQRPDIQKMTVSANENGFNLKQGSFVATTDFPVEIDAKSAKMSVTTSRGKEYVSVFPVEAIESVLRSGLATKITDKNITIKYANNELTYNIHGEKVFNILNLTEYKLPVDLSVSLSDGRIVSVNSSSPVYKVVRIFII